ncbi:MAG: alpha/beta fold hydrolase [Nitrospirae bacterium]|nr:alpha/beta fold hydrolase [Nitrospirota bacterium]
MKATINGIQLAYDDEGLGTPLVFLHAFPMNRRMWTPQRAALASRYRVIALDLRGHGESDAPLWHYSEDLRALLDHLAVQQAVLIGLSMGGYILFAFHRNYPERIKALVFADTRAEADKPEQVTWRFQLAQRAHTLGASVVADEMVPKLLASGSQTRPELVEQVRAIIHSTPVTGIAGDLMAIAERPDSTGQLAGIRCPTLVIVGQQDGLTTPDENRRIAEGIAGARLAVIPAAGHLSSLEQPEAFNAALLEFLQRIQ